jgi:hypothetical protein
MLVYGRRIPLNELEARIDVSAVWPVRTVHAYFQAISAASLRNVCMRHLYDRDLAVAAVGTCVCARLCRSQTGNRVIAGQTEAFEEYVTLRARMSWWRL